MNEGPKSRAEADYSFDPLSATPAAWEMYLLNQKNFEKDFTQGDYPFKSPASTIIEHAKEKGISREALETAAGMVLRHWDTFAKLHPIQVQTNPIQFVIALADDASVDIMQKLWTEAPKESEVLEDGLRHVAEALGANIPLTEEDLEKLYVDQFDTYRFIPLEILLKRGETARAALLFEKLIDRYGTQQDPGMFDRLVRLGLPAASAKKWLDQSVNRPENKDYAYHYTDALKRWGYTKEG